MDRSDTIFALSSGKLPSGIGVIRISGSRTRSVLETITGKVPPPRVMHRTDMRDMDGFIVDRGLYVFFGAPLSFTGEDCAELHVHGSLAVVRKLADLLSSIEGVRPAEAGEFTRRAFLGGKLDLAEAEGLSDLLAAETESQRRLAIAQSDGTLSAVYNRWRERLIYCRSLVEASIDFSEEEDVALDAVDQSLAQVSAIRKEIEVWLSRSANSEIVRDGFRVVILGAPNAGKSSLLNVLAGRDAALISDEPGTTRDLIDVRMNLRGNLVIVTDTAGIRSDPGKIEAMGIDKAMVRAKDADMVILLEDVLDPEGVDIELPGVNFVKVGNKIDLGPAPVDRYDVVISTRSMAGIDQLLEAISDSVVSTVKVDTVLTVQQRQKALLFDCVRSLRRCEDLKLQPELAAEQLRLATGCIGRLTGDVDVEELLGVIFSRFCIGK